MKMTIALLAALIAVGFLTTSCRKEEPVYNTKQILSDIKEQAGITLSTNTKVLKVGDDDRDPEDCRWLVYVKSPEQIQMPPDTDTNEKIEDGKLDKGITKEVENFLGNRITNPAATAINVWERPVGQFRGELVRTHEGDYLYLKRFGNSSFAQTNAPVVLPK